MYQKGGRMFKGYAVKKILGKRITGVVRKGGYGVNNLFLIFDDDTYFEFYTDGPINTAGRVDPGDMERVLKYMSPPKSNSFKASLQDEQS